MPIKPTRMSNANFILRLLSLIDLTKYWVQLTMILMLPAEHRSDTRVLILR